MYLATGVIASATMLGAPCLVYQLACVSFFVIVGILVCKAQLPCAAGLFARSTGALLSAGADPFKGGCCLCSWDKRNSRGMCPAGTLAAGLEVALPEAAHGAENTNQLLQALPAPSAPVFDLSQDTPFWENIARYGQYFFSVMLGTGYVMLKPFAGLLKRPVTAVLLIAFVIGFGLFLKTTVNAMLGKDDLFEYDPINDVRPNNRLERL
jgi:Protein of unknown function (DUF751)